MALVPTRPGAAMADALPNIPAGPYADIILPPQAVRAVIDKTAEFVARQGLEFEKRMLADPNARERFEFLFPTSPFRPYYDVKLQEYQAGEVQQVKPALPAAIADMRQKEQAKQEKLLMLKNYAETIDEISSDEEEIAAARSPAGAAGVVTGEGKATDRTEVEGVLPPDPDRFILLHPPLNAMESDVVKLTAQFVAVNGDQWLIGLQHRESSNPRFEFLRPGHPANAYFNSLVEGYRVLMRPERRVLEWLYTLTNRDPVTGETRPSSHPDDDYEAVASRRLVKRMRERQKWTAAENKKRRAREEAEAEERAAMAAIDWNDFTVVETVMFTEADKQMALPVPGPLVEIATGRIPVIPPMVPKPAPTPTPVIAEGVDNVTARPSGPHVLPIPTAAAAVQPVPAPTVIPVAPKPAVPAPAVPVTVAPSGAGDASVVIVKTDYVRKRRGERKTRMLQKCPLTGQLIPVEQMTHHLKVLLLDPKWKEQKDQLLERASKDQALAPGQDVEAHIAQFVLKRPDLFGTVEDEILEHASEPMPSAVAVTGSAAAQSATIRRPTVVPPPNLGNVQIIPPPTAAISSAIDPVTKKPRTE